MVYSWAIQIGLGLTVVPFPSSRGCGPLFLPRHGNQLPPEDAQRLLLWASLSYVDIRYLKMKMPMTAGVSVSTFLG
jgi:hypothetical protein